MQHTCHGYYNVWNKFASRSATHLGYLNVPVTRAMCADAHSDAMHTSRTPLVQNATRPGVLKKRSGLTARASSGLVVVLDEIPLYKQPLLGLERRSVIGRPRSLPGSSQTAGWDDCYRIPAARLVPAVLKHSSRGHLPGLPSGHFYFSRKLDHVINLRNIHYLPKKLNFTALYILEPASFLHWLLRRREVAAFLIGLHVIGIHNYEVFIYWRRVTQGVPNKVLPSGKPIAQIGCSAVEVLLLANSDLETCYMSSRPMAKVKLAYNVLEFDLQREFRRSLHTLHAQSATGDMTRQTLSYIFYRLPLDNSPIAFTPARYAARKFFAPRRKIAAGRRGPTPAPRGVTTQGLAPIVVVYRSVGRGHIYFNRVVNHEVLLLEVDHPANVASPFCVLALVYATMWTAKLSGIHQGFIKASGSPCNGGLKHVYVLMEGILNISCSADMCNFLCSSYCSRCTVVTMKVKRGEYGAAPHCNGGENRRSRRKPANQRHRPGTIPACENTGSNPAGNRARFALVGGE
ncbi:hypothetical protein PR048_007637 [Dryococelus australis]|uniref:Uncharacterized protein n=1 Tax=Dryococelus australis TaxID=614101 RepID=A0ABQ9HUS9_9NEOP|nr:hypothetical protein PR048_007637 [Dryococelus australis]